MADRRRIVTLDAAGTATVVVDLEAAGSIQTVRGSWKVNPSARVPVKSKRQRRYGITRTVAETHDEGSITFSLLVQGASVDACLASISSVLQVLEAPRNDLFYEWKPDGASVSTFYQITGPARYGTQYEWAQMVTAHSMVLDIDLPVAPLARLTPQTFTIASTVLPAVKALTSIGGDAPAIANVTLRTNGGTSPPVWALFGWCKHPTVSPLASSVAPFGIIEGETGTSLTTWSVAADANSRGGSRLVATGLSGAGSASASYVVDPSVLDADDFADGEIDVEVWGRLTIGSTLVSPRVVLSLTPDAGSGFGETVYTEFGSSGKALVTPTTGGNYMVRLGVLTMPVDKAQPVKWRIKVDYTWAGAPGTGTAGLDYLLTVPAKSRACSKTGVSNDSVFPKFIASTADTSKTIRGHDLFGLVGSAALNQGRDSGLCGSLIEFPPGDVDLLLKLSSLVPDDPVAGTVAEQLAHTVTGSVTVFPRVFLAK